MKLLTILLLTIGLISTTTAKDVANTGKHDPWSEGKFKFKKNKNAEKSQVAVDPWGEGKYKFKKNNNKPTVKTNVDPWGQGKYHR